MTCIMNIQHINAQYVYVINDIKGNLFIYTYDEYLFS